MALSLHRAIMLMTAVWAVCTAAPTNSTPMAATRDPQSLTLLLYRVINNEMEELRKIQKTTYDNYKVDRFGSPNSYMLIPPSNIAGVPNLSNLSVAERFAMNESDLLQLHRSNLQAFRQLMEFVVMDDEGRSNSPMDFSTNFSTISARLNRVVANIETEMGHLGHFPNGLPAPPTVPMVPEDDEDRRNTRDLYVLQEMYSYLSLAAYDLRIRENRHAYNFASQ